MSNIKKPETHPVSAAPENTTEAENIWNEIANLPIEMFALPNQVVAQHATPFPFHVDPSRLLLQVRSTSVLPALEAALEAEVKKNTTLATAIAAAGRVPPPVKKYNVELNDRFVAVSRALPVLTLPLKK